MPKFHVELHVTYIYEGDVEAEDDADARDWVTENETDVISDWTEQREGAEIYVSAAEDDE